MREGGGEGIDRSTDKGSREDEGGRERESKDRVKTSKRSGLGV